MGKRLRRDTEDIDTLASYNSESALASTASEDKSIRHDNVLQSTMQGQRKAHESSCPGIGIRCTLPPHRPMSFFTQSDYETHYLKDHVNRCDACGKNFPTEHYLNLHIAENHDPINEVLKQKDERIVLLCFSLLLWNLLILSIVWLFRGRMRS